MKAMILAAGLGTRLRPLTLERAKPAVPLIGKPLVVRLVEKLLENGADAFRLNLHHLPDTIKAIFRSAPARGLPVSFSHEPELLGTAGGIKANESFFDQGTFLLVNGDIVMDLPLRAALDFHRRKKALATLILYPQSPPYVFFPVRIDEQGNLTHFKGIPDMSQPGQAAYVFTGIHILEPEIFRFIPPRRFWEINDQVYPEAIKLGERVFGFPVEGYWSDLGDPGRYLSTQKDVFQRMTNQRGTFLSPRAKCSASSSVGPNVSIGAGSTLEADTLVENSILWEDVRVRSGSKITNCVIGSSVTIEGHHSDKVITRNGEAPIVLPGTGN
jgi:mannose-1-phosphate guanylyltransferase